MQLSIMVDVEFVVTGGKIYLTKTIDFKNTKIIQQSKIKGWNCGNINIPKAPVERPINGENLLSPCRIAFKFLYQALRYSQYHFQNKLWNKNEMLEYLRPCCFSKNVTFNAIEAF